MKKMSVKTDLKKQVVDITDRVEEQIQKLDQNSGLCHLFLLHTTAALTTADLDLGTDLDMLDAFEAIVPNLKYRHPHSPEHVGDHIISSIIGASLTLPFVDKKLALGTWQRVVLIELDGPRKRELIISLA